LTLNGHLRSIAVLLAACVGPAAPLVGSPKAPPIDRSGAAGYICNGGDIPHCYPTVGQMELTFSRRFEGGYRPGEPYDVLTIAPNGSGETLAQIGVRLRVQIVCSCEAIGPIAGIPAAEMVLYGTGMCSCPAGSAADHDTDADGWTEFSGTILGGGCAPSVILFVDGVATQSIPLKINSPDTRDASPCGVDSSDLSALAERLGRPQQYGICFDFNEDGAIDAGDLSYFATVLGSSCR
jgi:hypothetical protein